MALVVYEGTLGGGKSYHAVQHALRYLASGGRVYSNIELLEGPCVEYCRRHFGVELQWGEQYTYLSANDIARLHEVCKGGTKDCPVLCILDEIHLYHNARDWSHASRGLLQWLTQSRKLFVDIICITQHRNNLDKQWIRLVARYFRFRDLRACKMPGLGIRFPFFQCLSVELDTDGKTVIERKWERFDLDVFGCYSSEQLFDGCVEGFAGAGRARVKLEKTKRKVGMKVYVMLGGCVVLICVLVFLLIRDKPISKAKRVLGRDVPIEQPQDGRKGRGGGSSSFGVGGYDFVPQNLPPPPPEWVSCDGWVGRDGAIVSGYSSRHRLIFRGPPDRVEDGSPVYAFRRGVPAW